MQITLGKKTFETKIIKARMVRRSVELTQNVDLNKMTTSDLDKMVEFVVEVFDKQFTVDELYDSLPANELIPTIAKTINMVVNGINSEFDNLEVKK